MLTKHEINALNLSPTKKDFVQIWNELLEVAGKLSERWDPTSTNESDPGIVLLKALTGIADKLNYNIDKNILEAFMPTAAQEDSMRKLCEMLGYNIKYYQSAKTSVTIKYHNSDPSAEEIEAINGGLYIPKFTVVSNADNDINYFTVNETPLFISADTPSQTIECMEGQIVKCGSTTDNSVITINQIDENNRFYLPETQIAENGIFIYNVFYNAAAADTNDIALEDGTPWEKVDNLNIYRRGERVFKFGYDSYESRPYVEFPDDYSDLFNDGLFIYYARTSGSHGNISSHTLTQLAIPNLTNWDKVSAESFSVDNVFAATSGANIETIKQAYKNFKKTIGTFETLVTCRDYMNKVYSMVNSVGKPYVSNILVTDMRNDLNKAVTICSWDDAGIYYKETPIVEQREVSREVYQNVKISNTATKPFIGQAETSTDRDTNRYIFEVVDDDLQITMDPDAPVGFWHISGEDGPRIVNNFIQGTYDWSNHTITNQFSFNYDKEVPPAAIYSVDSCEYWLINQVIDEDKNQAREVTFVTKLPAWIYGENTVGREVEKVATPLINHFDIVFYPFKAYNQIKSEITDVKSIYDSSFNYTNIGFNDIKARLESDQLKTITHNIVTPTPSSDTYVGDIVSINNYLRLNATIATNTKITIEEGSLLKNKIKVALANAFNMRELDFGEEIPFESIIEVIEGADSRIKVASLNEPALYTTYSVFDHLDSAGHPVIAEYGVASEYLTEEDAINSGRFIYEDARGNKQSSFDTNAARKIYNKLVLRNVLAGRVALFNYNNTFTPSLTEAPYQKTLTYAARPANFPAGLETPTADNPYTVWVENGVTYSAYITDTAGKKCVFTESKTPDVIKDNVISNIPDTTSDNTNNITKITPYLDITLDTSNQDKGACIKDLTLEKGETIKFRAPNFTTVKTYPAYVNYHLVLNEELNDGGEAIAAEAESLFNILDSDRSTWSDSNAEIKWQKVLDYFKAADASNAKLSTPTEYVQTFTLKQEISKFKQTASSGEDTCPVHENGQHVIDTNTNTCRYCGAAMFSQVQKGAIVVDIKNNETNEKDVDSLFAKSGCVKLTNKCVGYDKDKQKYLFRANLLWSPATGEAAPAGTGPKLDIDIGLTSPFITNIGTLANIKELVSTAIEERKNMVKEDGVTPVLPSECSWTVSFDFECVPFEAASLNEWDKFIKLCAQSDKDVYGSVLSFTPVEELGTVLWRTFGEGYDVGKYVQTNSQKLLKFDKNYFSLLPQNSVLTGIYLAASLGKDESPNIIYNAEEYQLKKGEYLYIEYTPSSTTEDGTVTELAPVTEIHGEGTIIRPNGFEVGLIDSDVYTAQGNTPVKTVKFLTSNGNTQELQMHRFGANEQVEIRDFSRVELSKSTFKSSPIVYIYKNFNNCSELETLSGADATTPRTYTLKDGEFIFYTDQNKAELAYFTSGTEVQLHGDLVLPKCESIDLAEVLDSSIEEIPWKYLPFENSQQKIVFQEFQYITLGQKDTINGITIIEPELKEDTKDKNKQYPILNNKWKHCANVSYTLSTGDNGTLPKINVSERTGDTEDSEGWNGWEVCSILDITASPDDAQQLRYIPNVINTGITLEAVSTGGAGTSNLVISAENLANDTMAANSAVSGTADEVTNTVLFKTNLACQTLSNNSINLEDIYNKNKVNSFNLRFFVEEPISIVQTLPGKVVPNKIVPLNAWGGEPVDIKEYSDIWTQINLDKIKPGEDCDNALRLSVSTIPGTYGIMCFCLTYTSSEAKGMAKTWIEFAPGTSRDDIKLYNSTNTWETAENGTEKLFLTEGINCIRINKTCKLFVKTTAVSQGTLMFDDLKLVDCGTLTYTAKDKNDNNEPIETKHKIPTYGFNMQQLRYLPLNANDENIFDSIVIKEKAEKALCDDLFNELDKIVVDIDENILAESAYFTDGFEQIKAISSDLDKIKSNTLSDDAFDALVTQYKTLSDSAKEERELLEQLSENSIEEDLLKLISQYASAEASKTQLLEKLAALKVQILNAIDTRTEEQSLNSFISTYSDNTLKNKHKIAIEKVFTEAQELTIKKANTNIVTELLELVSALETAVAANEKARVQEAINRLQIAAKASNIIDVQVILNKISDSLDIGDINSLLIDIKALVLVEEYSAVVPSAIALKNAISAKSVSFYVEELNNIIINGNKTQAEALANDFNDILSLKNDIITLIDKLIAECQKSSPSKNNINKYITNTNSSEPGITELVDELYQKKITNLATELLREVPKVFGTEGNSEEIKKAIDALNDLIKKLDKNTGEEVATITNKISSLLDTFNGSISVFSNIDISMPWPTLKENKYYDILSSFIGALWPITFKKLWINAFETLIGTDSDPTTKTSLKYLIAEEEPTNTAIFDAIGNVKKNVATYKSNFAAYDLTLIDIDSLNTIVEAAIIKGRTYIKNQDLIEIISAIKNAAGVDTIITSAKSNFTNTNRTTVLSHLLTEWSDASTSAARKITLLASIKIELEKLLASDEYLLAIIEDQLFSVIASILAKYTDADEETKKNSYEYSLSERLRYVILETKGSYKPIITLYTAFDNLIEAIEILKSGSVAAFLKRIDSFLVEELLLVGRSNELIGNLRSNVNTKDKIALIRTTLTDKADIETIEDLQTNIPEGAYTTQITDLLADLKAAFDAIADAENCISTDDPIEELAAEEQLLKDLMSMDTSNEFYYTVPVETHSALEFIGNRDYEKSMMNPAINYDINNVNNSFVISKLDMDYLDEGLTISRASRLN